MAKRPDGVYYVAGPRRLWLYVGRSPNGETYDHPVAREQGDYLTRVVTKLDKDALDGVFAEAEVAGNPSPTVYHAPLTGRVFGTEADLAERLSDRPRLLTRFLFKTLGLKCRPIHLFSLPMRRIVAQGGRVRTTREFALSVVVHDEGDNN
jgi:hypothetical protein